MSARAHLTATLLAISLLTTSSLRGQQTITAITTRDVAASFTQFTNRQDLSCSSSAFNPSANYRSAFGGASGRNLELTSITVAGRTLSPSRISSTVKLRRKSAGPTAILGLFEPQVVSTSRTNPYVTLRSSYASTVDELMAGNIINRGIDNPFGGCVQAMRLDYYLPPFQVPAAADLSRLGFSVFEFGNTWGSGDAFRIAAITGIGSEGNPSCYGPLITVAANDFGSTGLFTFNNDERVQYVITNGGDATARPGAVWGGTIRGVFLTLSTLGVSTGSSVYGFSVFDMDTNTSNPDACHSDLLDWETFASSSSTSIDLTGGGFLIGEPSVTVTSIPEVCGNNFDDDGDGLADDLDLDCCLEVTQTGDSGAGSLRQALTCANYHPGANTITFDIPTSDPGYRNPDAIALNADDVWEIRLTSGDLPTITEPVTIDGSSQNASACVRTSSNTSISGLGTVGKLTGTRILVHAQRSNGNTQTFRATANTSLSHIKLLNWAPGGGLANMRLQATPPARISLSCMDVDRQ